MALTRLPGLIDVHTHLREPGASHKEDFYTGGKAAIRGGFTFILDMPNNPVPTLTLERLEEKIKLAQKSLCEVGFYFGSDGKNLSQLLGAASYAKVFGLKIYLNDSTGNLDLSDERIVDSIFAAWQSDKPILVHAEGRQLDAALNLALKYNRRLHICHVSDKRSVELIRAAKPKMPNLSCATTPHYLFLTTLDLPRLGAFSLMKPPLPDSAGQAALWQGLLDGTLDLIESDHAPHTLEEKQSANPPVGVPGLETTLGLLGRAMREGRINLTHIQTWLYENPKRLFHLPNQDETFIEADFEKVFRITSEKLESKCKWSPFAGMDLYGRVENVTVYNKQVLKQGEWV